MKTHIIIIFLFLYSENFGQVGYYEEYPSIVDSIILKSRTNEKVIVIQNDAGIRKEFWFNEKGSRKFDVLTVTNFEEGNEIAKIQIDTIYYQENSIKKNDVDILINPEIRDSVEYFNRTNQNIFLGNNNTLILIEKDSTERAKHYFQSTIQKANDNYTSQVDSFYVKFKPIEKNKMNHIKSVTKWKVVKNSVVKIENDPLRNEVFFYLPKKNGKYVSLKFYRISKKNSGEINQYEDKNFPKYKITYCKNELKLPKKMKLNYQQYNGDIHLR
jgi:hypothetical protein